jgi:hypothetical protein
VTCVRWELLVIPSPRNARRPRRALSARRTGALTLMSDVIVRPSAAEPQVGAPSGTSPVVANDPLAGLREHLDALRESEDLFARQVEIQRESEGYYRRSAEFLVQQRGWSEAVYDLIASRSKAVAAAETSFAAAVELREATQRLIAELEEEDR